MTDANPYSAPESELEDVEKPVSSHYHLASRGTRLVAAIVDGAVFIFPAFVLGMVSSSNPDIISGVMMLFGAIILGVNVFFLVQNAQTIGKKVLGIRVIRPTGEKASFGRIFALRYLLNALIGMIPLYSLIDVLFIFRQDKRCIHDMLADTYVEEL